MLPRCVIIALLLALIATACGDASGDSTVPPPFGTEQEQLAARLVELEPAPGEDWDRDSVLDALAAARRLFVLGWDRDAPINLTALTLWVADHPDAVTDADWDRIIDEGEGTALGIRAVPAAFTDHESRQTEYLALAERADDAFALATGHGLGIPIFIALSDLPLLENDAYAAAASLSGTALIGLRLYFSPDRFREFAAEYRTTIGADPACLIVLGTTFTDTFGALRQTAGLMHEITHCHQHAIHPDGALGFAGSGVPWMDEGYAGWAGEAFAGGTEHSARWWDSYLEGTNNRWELYGSGVEGISLFSHLEANGVDAWDRFIDYFAEIRQLPSDSDRYLKLTAPLSRDQLGAWPAGPARRPAWGRAWNATGPGITETARSPRTETLGAGEVVLLETGEATQSLHRFEISPPGDDSYLIAVAGRGAGRLRWGWGEDIVIDDGTEEVWCFGPDCTCEDGTSPVPGATVAPIGAGETPQLDVALIGPPRRVGRFGARMETLEDVCDDPASLGIVEIPPPTVIAATTTTGAGTTTVPPTTTTSTMMPTTTTTSPVDPATCLIGEWDASTADIETYVLTLYRLFLTPTFLGGSMDATFAADGTFSTNLVDTMFEDVLPTGEFVVATFNGGSTGTWEATGNELTVEIASTSASAVLVVDGIPLTPAPITTGPSGDRTVQFTCNGELLTIEPESANIEALWPLPRTWKRVT